MNSEPPVTFIRDPDVVVPPTPITTDQPIDVNVLGGTLVANVTIPSISTSPQPIKDGVGATLSSVKVANGATAVTSNVLLVQHVDKAGAVLAESTQGNIDLNTANAALLLLDVDETGSRQLAAINQLRTEALSQSGTRVTLVDTHGRPFESYTDSEGEQHLGVSIRQSVYGSSLNSTTAPLNALGRWTGTSESTLGVSGIQVMMKASTNSHLYVEQSGDGINWDVIDHFDYDARANAESFSVTVQAVGSYFRVRAENKASFAQTYLRVFTALCPTVEALPRATDARGHLQVTTHGLSDDFGFQGEFTPMRDQKVCQPYRLVGVNFAGTVDQNFWVCTNAGLDSGASITTGVARVFSGVANSGYGQLQSNRSARFVFAHPHLYRALIKLDGTLKPENTRRWGAFTTVGNNVVDGFYFETNGWGTVSCKCAASGVVNYSATSGNFNGVQSEFHMDAKVHAYEIVHFVAGAWFYIDDILVQSFKPDSAPLADTITLPTTISSVNSASSTSSGTIDAWASTILRLGRDVTAPTNHWHPSSQTAANNLKRGAGSLHGFVVASVATNGAVLTIYDSLTATGKIIYQTGALQTTDRNVQVASLNLPFYIGLTYSVTTQNAAILFTYE